jgi:hypothetical protein
MARRLLSAETQVWSHASLCEICCGKWHFDRFFSQYFGFPLSVLFHQWSVIVCIYKLFLRKEETEAVLKCSKGSVLFEIGGIGQKNTPFFTWPSSERVSVRLWPLCHRVYPCASGWPSDRQTRSRFHMVYLGRRASAVLHYSFEATVLMATYLHNTWSSASLFPFVITEFCITQRGNLTLRYECLSAVYVGV